MRIALVSLHTSPLEQPGRGDAGGMNVVVREAAIALERLGHTVTVFTRASVTQSPGDHVIPDSNVRIIALAAGEVALPKVRLPEIVPEFTRALRDAATRLGPVDVWHSHYWLSGMATREITDGTPHAVTLHTVAAQKNTFLAQGQSPEPTVRLDGERLLAREAFIIAASHSELRGITEGYGPVSHSAVVHPGVDTELFRPRITGRSDQERPLRLTVLGRVQPLKGQDLAIRTLEYLSDTPVELTISGEATPGDEPYLDELRRLAANLGESSQVAVRFVSAKSRADAARLLAESDIVLVPSHSETFGLIALEAAACGVVVVAQHTTGLTESVRDGVTGVLVRGRDPRNWARAIRSLDPETRARMGRAAREHAVAHSWDAHARRLTDLYRDQHTGSYSASGHEMPYLQ